MNHPFWSDGFRPFFLLAALFAALAIPVWLLQYTAVAELPIRGGPLYWHIHEMLFAFGAAAVAGFLTTAVPNWTATPPMAGTRVLVLTALWLAGRAVWLVSGLLPAWLVAVVDLAFLPALILALAPAVAGARQWRNMPIFVLILTLFAGNLLLHLDLLDLWPGAFGDGTIVAIVTLTTLITMVGGRIVPAFTRNALAARGRPVAMRSSAPLDAGAILSGAVAGAALLIAPDGPVAGYLAALAAILNLARLVRWHGWRTLSLPIVWVLHVAYLWIPVGWGLLAAAQFSGAVSPSAGWHALTVGAIGTMIMAVTTRAALGHTGRPLVAPRPMIASYLFLTGAAAARVAAAVGLDVGQGMLLYISAGLWTAAFALFVFVYFPILTRPRADVQAGPALR